MEKRLPLFLFLSLCILFVWNVCNPRQPVTKQEGTELVQGPTGAVGPGAAGAPGTPDALEAFAPALADTEVREETLFFGRPGEPGHLRAVVSNRGARLVELAIGTYYQFRGLTAEEQANPENWTRIVVPAETGEGTLGSLLMRTRPSSADLAPAGLDTVLWTMEVLRDAAGDPTGVEWRYDPGRGVAFTKRLTPIPNSYHLTLELELTNTGQARLIK